MDQKHIMGFKHFLSEEKKLSKNTVENYTRDVRGFLDSNEKEIEDSSSTDILSYMIGLQRSGMKSSTVARKLASVRCFYQFLMNEGRIRRDPTIGISMEVEERKTPETLSYEDVSRLLDSPDVNTDSGSRDRAILELMYGSGLKVGEITELTVEDVNLDMEYVRCRSERSGDRFVPINSQSRRFLGDYVAYSRHTFESGEKTESLFLNKGGKGFSRQGIWKMINKHAEAAGIGKKINAITLRHSFAMHLLENGATLDSIKDLLGHSALSTTQIYMKKADEKLKEIYSRAHPRK